MFAKQVSKDREIFCTSEMPLTEVFNRMTNLECKCMPIVESQTHKNIIGTITEHDICLKILNGGLNPQRISAGRVMNGDFTTVSGDATVEECAELLMLAGLNRLFVVDENGAYMGILTENEVTPTEKPTVNLKTVITDLSTTSALPPKIQLAF